MDAPNDAIDFLELPVAATLRSRDVLVCSDLAFLKLAKIPVLLC